MYPRPVSSVREQSPPVLPDREYELAAELRQTLTEFLRHSERITRKHGLTNERY